MAFGKLAQQSVSVGKVVRLVLNQLKGEPVLLVRHLGESNPDYFNDAIAKANTMQFAGTGKLTPQAIAEAREKNRATVAKYAVVGLENVFHDDGRPATDADIFDLVHSLPADVFDVVLNFVRNADHFRDVAIDSDAKATAGK